MRKGFINFFVSVVTAVVAVMAIPGSVVMHLASQSVKRPLHIAMATESTSTTPRYNVLSVAGALWGDGKSKTDMKLHFPQDHIFAPDGSVYICDGIQGRVRKIDSQGNVSTVAGTYFFGFTDGLGGPATEATLSLHNCSLALHGQDLYILQADGNSLLKLNLSTGILTLVAGTPDSDDCEDPETPCGDEGPATEAQFANPRSVRLNPAATALFISDLFNNRVRKIDLATGIITTVAGNGQEGSAGDDGLAISAQVTNPDDVAFDSAGNMYIAERGGNRIRKVTPAGIISRYAGTGDVCEDPETPCGDGGQAIDAQISDPVGVAVDPQSRYLYIYDSGNRRIRRVEMTTGVISNFFGTGKPDPDPDGGLATQTSGNFPNGFLSFDHNNHVCFTNLGALRCVDLTTQRVSTYAGDIYFGDGGTAANARFADPWGILIQDNKLTVTSRLTQSVRRADPNDPLGTITRIVGNQARLPYVDGLPALQTAINTVWDTAYDNAGNTYVASDRQNAILKVDASTGLVSKLISGGSPHTVTYDKKRNRLYVTGFDNGTVVTAIDLNQDPPVASPFVGGFADAFDVSLDQEASKMLVADDFGNVIWLVDLDDPEQAPQVIAGNGSYGSDGDGGPAIDAAVGDPLSAAFDPQGNVFISGAEFDLIRMVDTNGIIHTVAGRADQFNFGYGGDGGPATEALYGDILRVRTDNAGNVYFIDFFNEKVRALTLPALFQSDILVKKKRKKVTVHLQVPGVNTEDIDLKSIHLYNLGKDGDAREYLAPSRIRTDEDEVIIKFNRAKVQKWVDDTNTADVVIEGKTKTGRFFSASTVINFVNNPKERNEKPKLNDKKMSEFLRKRALHGREE